MAKNNKMPAIRFSGYTDTWEQRKLGDIATFSKGNGYSKSDLALSGNPIILYGRLYTNYETTISNVDTFVELKDKSVLSQGGEVIVPASGENAEDISRASVVKNQGIIIGGDLNVIKANHLLDPTFLALTISNGGQQKELSKRAQGKSVVHLHNSDLQEVNLIFPLLNEQKEISTLFEKMDNIITLHQRKLEKLKLTKKALLQKLFPQNGSKFPELRFKGFTAAWEQCKLSDITEIVMGQSPSSKNYTDNPNDNILVQGNADLKDGKVVPRLWTKEITKTIDKDGIVLTVRAPVGDVAKTDYKVVLGRGVAGIKGNDYIYQFLQKLQNNRYWVSLSSGSTFESINSNDIKDLIIDIPSIEEQTKISMLLNNVNSIITLHQRKLEMLKNVKKGLLQKMFV